MEETVPSSRVLFVRDEGGREMCGGSVSQWGKVDDGWANNCGLASVSEWACGDSLSAKEMSVAEVKGGGPTERGAAA